MLQSELVCRLAVRVVRTAFVGEIEGDGEAVSARFVSAGLPEREGVSDDLISAKILVLAQLVLRSRCGI